MQGPHSMFTSCQSHRCTHLLIRNTRNPKERLQLHPTVDCLEKGQIMGEVEVDLGDDQTSYSLSVFLQMVPRH